MRFIQHYSGSKGNLYELNCCGDRLLIDPGVSWNKLLSALDFNLLKIQGCLVTHEDKDHCKAVSEVAKNGIQVYATKETLANTEMLNKHNFHARKKLCWHKIGNFAVYFFPTIHDCEGSVGFMIKYGNERMLFATDTACIAQDFSRFAFDIIAIECNYDDDKLSENVKNGLINESLAKRIINTHMSKKICKDFLEHHCNLSKCTEIHLIHLSENNIVKDNLVKEFEDELLIKTIIL